MQSSAKNYVFFEVFGDFFLSAVPVKRHFPVWRAVSRPDCIALHRFASVGILGGLLWWFWWLCFRRFALLACRRWTNFCGSRIARNRATRATRATLDGFEVGDEPDRGAVLIPRIEAFSA